MLIDCKPRSNVQNEQALGKDNTQDNGAQLSATPYTNCHLTQLRKQLA